MEQLSVLDSRKKSTVTKLTRSSKIFKTIIQAIEDKKGEQIISLDLRKIPEAVSDFFIISIGDGKNFFSTQICNRWFFNWHTQLFFHLVPDESVEAIWKDQFGYYPGK